MNVFEAQESSLRLPINIGASGLESIEQNIRIILLTLAYSVPLDREFAGKQSFIDSPSPVHTGRLIAEITEALEKYEPRIKVKSVNFMPYPDLAMKGSLYPVITYELRQQDGGGFSE